MLRLELPQTSANLPNRWISTGNEIRATKRRLYSWLAETLFAVAVWMETEAIKTSEISHSRKCKSYTFLLVPRN